MSGFGGPWRMLIGEEWVDAGTGETFETFDPGTGEVLARVPEADAADVDLAVAAARAAFTDRRWLGLPVAQRSAAHPDHVASRRPDRPTRRRAGRA